MQQIFNRKVIQKIMALLVILVLSNFIMSTKVYAADESFSSVEEYDDSESDSGFFGVLFSPITALFIGIGDAINYIFRTAIVGSKAADGQGYRVVIAGQRAIDYMKANDATNDSEPPTVYISRTGIDHSYGTTYAVSAIDYTPVEIFAGRIYASFWSAFNLYGGGELMVFSKRNVDIIDCMSGDPKKFED